MFEAICKRSTLTIVALAATALCVPSWSFADPETLTKVKSLYASAAYEDALAAMASVPPEGREPELDRYRAFCLIALGDQQQAQVVIEKVLEKDPLYRPDATEISPRVIEAFTEMRRRVLPSVAKKQYLDAKTALERKERATAIAGFEVLLRLLESPELSDSSLGDMKVLADGFLTLSKALPEERAPQTDTASPAAANGAVAANGTPAAKTAVGAYTRPIPIRQDMPIWNAPDGVSRRSEYSGVIRVKVTAEGKVEAVEIVKRSHPMYDGQLLRAARNWTYQPARQGNVPVASEVLVEVQLRPDN